jgi:hypothetical protein
MYGAYGQPLPPANHTDAYGQPARPQQQPQYLPSPTAGPYSYGPPSAHSDEGSRDEVGRKRPHPEPHTPTLPPPNPGAASQAPHRATAQDYVYPEPSSLTTAPRTATPSAAYSAAPPPAQPYYTAQPPRQGSPQSAYRYDPSRTSSSPHSQAPTTPGSAPASYYAAPQQNGTLQPLPPRSDGRTPPPPASQPAARPGMRINDLVSDSGNGRSSTDSDMLNMLNRRPM